MASTNAAVYAGSLLALWCLQRRICPILSGLGDIYWGKRIGRQVSGFAGSLNIGVRQVKLIGVRSSVRQSFRHAGFSPT